MSIDFSKMITAEDKLENDKALERSVRDTYLSQSDWVVTRAQELGEPVPEDWAAYRQALRDVPEQEGFPYNIEWPTSPKGDKPYG